MEVGAANAHPKESVARECHLLGSTIEQQTARRMTRHVERLQLMAAKGDEFAVSDVMTHGGQVEVKGDAHHLAGLLAGSLIEKLVVGMQLGLQAVGLLDEVGSEVMVEMTVGAQQMDRSQL